MIERSGGFVFYFGSEVTQVKQIRAYFFIGDLAHIDWLFGVLRLLRGINWKKISIIIKIIINRIVIILGLVSILCEIHIVKEV